MTSNLGMNMAGSSKAYDRNHVDFYSTPQDVTKALVREMSWIFRPADNFTIWEPACGDGAMVSVFQDNLYRCVATDIRHDAKGFTMDFLDPSIEPAFRFDCIITNPPSKLAEDFIRKAASYNVPFAFLLKSTYWHAKSRAKLFKEITPSHIFPLTWRPNFTPGRSSPSTMNVMWCVWGRRNLMRGAFFAPINRPTI